MIKANELERDLAGLIQKDTKKKLYKDRSAKIEQYSLLLREEKISCKQFLNTMANVDNKIIFDEGEFPVIDPDEIEFSDIADKNLYSEILKERFSNDLAQASDAIPVVLNTSTDVTENVSITSPEPPTILTRSQARKALQKKDLTSPKKRSNKRRAQGENSNNASEIERSKRTKVCRMSLYASYI